MLIAFSITPLGVGESVGDLVADAITAKVAHVEARLAEG